MPSNCGKVGTGIWVASHADFLFTFSNKKSEEQSRKKRSFIASELDSFGHVKDIPSVMEHVPVIAGTQYRDKLVPKQNVRDITA